MREFFPAKELCSDRQLFYTHYIHYVKKTCAFINQQIGELEPKPIRNRGIINNPDEIYRKDGITFVCASTNCVQELKMTIWQHLISSKNHCFCA